jgi:hypothetical protein
MNPFITANEVSDGMKFNNVKSGIITADHDIGELKMNAYQNGVDLSHNENEGERNNFSLDEKKEERKNFTLDETKRGKVVKQNMVMFNRLELGEQNANKMTKKDTVVSLQSVSGEKINDDEYMLFYHMRTQLSFYLLHLKIVITDEGRNVFMKGSLTGKEMI